MSKVPLLLLGEIGATIWEAVVFRLEFKGLLLKLWLIYWVTAVVHRLCGC